MGVKCNYLDCSACTLEIMGKCYFTEEPKPISITVMAGGGTPDWCPLKEKQR